MGIILLGPRFSGAGLGVLGRGKGPGPGVVRQRSRAPAREKTRDGHEEGGLNPNPFPMSGAPYRGRGAARIDRKAR